MITMTIIDPIAFENEMYDKFANDLWELVDHDQRMDPYVIIDWLEDNGLTTYDQIKEKYNNQN